MVEMFEPKKPQNGRAFMRQKVEELRKERAAQEREERIDEMLDWYESEVKGSKIAPS